MVFVESDILGEWSFEFEGISHVIFIDKTDKVYLIWTEFIGIVSMEIEYQFFNI